MWGGLRPSALFRASPRQPPDRTGPDRTKVILTWRFAPPVKSHSTDRTGPDLKAHARTGPKLFCFRRFAPRSTSARGDQILFYLALRASGLKSSAGTRFYFIFSRRLDGLLGPSPSNIHRKDPYNKESTFLPHKIHTASFFRKPLAYICRGLPPCRHGSGTHP